MSVAAICCGYGILGMCERRTQARLVNILCGEGRSVAAERPFPVSFILLLRLAPDASRRYIGVFDSLEDQA